MISIHDDKLEQRLEAAWFKLQRKLHKDMGRCSQLQLDRASIELIEAWINDMDARVANVMKELTNEELSA